MHHTHYHRPATVADVIKLLDQHGDDKLIDLRIKDVPLPAQSGSLSRRARPRPARRATIDAPGRYARARARPRPW